jgi:hypothetical protein
MATKATTTATATETTATEVKLSMREKLALTIETLEAKETLTDYEAQRLVNASKRMAERQPGAIYRSIKKFHNTKLPSDASNEERLTRVNLRKITGGKLPTFGEWIEQFGENANFSFWSGLTAVRKACKERKEA